MGGPDSQASTLGLVLEHGTWDRMSAFLMGLRAGYSEGWASEGGADSSSGEWAEGWWTWCHGCGQGMESVEVGNCGKKQGVEVKTFISCLGGP